MLFRSRGDRRPAPGDFLFSSPPAFSRPTLDETASEFLRRAFSDRVGSPAVVVERAAAGADAQQASGSHGGHAGRTELHGEAMQPRAGRSAFNQPGPVGNACDGMSVTGVVELDGTGMLGGEHRGFDASRDEAGI